ncbi:hypothetical protein [Spartinivicinus poritis]|uniref:Solute-binding protein family 3/N-terminal domain-containing protein n=1 Tax=Spartinivicinus poritis TaxID=2994640 RepID=A0ABT5UFH9_9GAMM|nr:hypothetical protein [Spartinivicinus sp. A2-2]MDE1463844.1 hypothetical protein [Spartinivicinus sp. A2-2]
MYSPIKHLLVVLIGFVAFSVNVQAELSLRYFQLDSRYIYRIQLLELALGKTEAEYGPFQLYPVQKLVTQARGLSLLEKNIGVDVAFLPTSVEREQRLLPIKIPILRGILGYRVLLVHEDLQPRFNKVTSLDQLKKGFVGGFGAHWADMAILQANGLKVVGITQYENLFKMLSYKRFDYFPRGINVAWKEVELKGDLYKGIKVEETLALYYPYLVYFFVSRSRPAIAARIEKGLKLALADGSFERLFKKHHKYLVQQAGLESRRLFLMKNPTLPAGTVLPDTSWWLKNTGQFLN